MFFVLRNMLKKNEFMEDFITKQSDAINACDQRLKEIDDKGIFYADDQIGFFFKEVQKIQEALNEFITIKIHDGLYDESNKFYFMSGQKETRLRTHLPLLMHQADHMAAQIEFELWDNSSNPKTNSKPANATKGDKTLRAAKKVNTENNPKLASATLDVIDSFFKD